MSQELLFDKSMKKIMFLFHLTGMNMTPAKRTLKQNWVFLFNFIWLNTAIVGAVHFVIRGILTGNNITEITFVAPCVTLSILGDIKGLLLTLNEKQVHKMVVNLRELEIRKNEFVNNDEEDVMKSEIGFLDLVIKVLNILNCLMIVVFDMSPLILIAVKYYKNGVLSLMLPFNDVYPFDAFNLRYWPFAYIHQIWAECIVLLEICATDYFFFTCCIHIRIQFRLLQRQLEDIIPGINLSATGSVSDTGYKDKLKELIKWHQQIISSASMLEVVYSKSTLFNFLTSSFVICLTGFNVTIINDITFQMTFLTFLFMSLLQVFFLCLFGDILMRSSMEVAEAVYNSQWYLSDVTSCKNVMQVQTRAQKPCKLTAAGFADVNLNAFMKILSTSWSYFALLQTIYGSQKEIDDNH